MYRSGGTLILAAALLAWGCGGEAPPAPPGHSGSRAVFDRGGAVMRHVSAGRVALGVGEEVAPPLRSFDNLPRHEVALGEFWMDETEVTNADYARFVAATGHPAPLHLEDGVAEIRFALGSGLTKATRATPFTVVTGTERGDRVERRLVLPEGGDETLAARMTAAALHAEDVAVVHNPAWPILTVRRCRSVAVRCATGGELEALLRGDAARGENVVEAGEEPVVWVSWNDAVAYARWVTSSRADGFVYRLPTEAEWECACRRGGPYAPFAGGSGTWTATRSGANSLGIRGLVENVSEWCADWYGEDYYAHSPTEDPTGPESGTDRVLRGGDWSRPLTFEAACAKRDFASPDTRSYNIIGFRLVRVAPRND